MISDAEGYHKALFAGMNVDKLAQHFYDLGRTEAIETNAKESKNIKMDPHSAKGEISKSRSKVSTVSRSDGPYRSDGGLKIKK